MDPQPSYFAGPPAPAPHTHKYSPRDSQLAVIILLLFIVMLVVFYGSRALHTPDCSKYCQRHQKPCPMPPTCPTPPACPPCK